MEVKQEEETFIQESESVHSPKKSCNEKLQVTERPYKCTFSPCTKAFNHRSTLVKHMRIHKGERPYKCNLCSQSFIQNSNLKRHMLTHTGEKPYGCDKCGKTFTTASNLRIHKQVHQSHQIREKFTCSYCHKNFLYRCSAFKHESRCTLRKTGSCKVNPSIEEIHHEPTKMIKKEEEEERKVEAIKVSPIVQTSNYCPQSKETTSHHPSKSANALFRSTGQKADSFGTLMMLLSQYTLPSNIVNALSVRLGQSMNYGLLIRSLAMNMELIEILKRRQFLSSKF